MSLSRFQSPRLQTRNIGSLISELTNPRVVFNLNPQYQRGSIWNIRTKQEFIESILINIIPTNIVLNENEDGSYVCIDGKQRLSAILDFVNGKFSLEHKKKHYCYTKKSNNIDPKSEIVDVSFDRTEIPVVIYKNLTYSEQCEIFNRLNKGTFLTAGEKISSVISDTTTCAIFNDFCNKQSDKIKKFVKSDRDKHKVFLIELIYIIDTNLFENLSKQKRDKYMKELTLPENINKLKKLLTNVAIAIDSIFCDKLMLNKKITPQLKKTVMLTAFYNIVTTHNNNWKSFTNNIIDKHINAIMIFNNTIKSESPTNEKYKKMLTDYEKILSGDDLSDNDSSDESNDDSTDNDTSDESSESESDDEINNRSNKSQKSSKSKGYK